MSLSVHASDRNAQKIADRLSAEQLMEKGRYYLITKNNPDSALFFNDLLVKKVSQKKELTKYDRRFISIGYNRQGYIYMFFLLNYSKAMANFLRAQDYCDDIDMQVSIYQNIGHIYSLYAECYPTDNNMAAARYFYKEAFSRAVKENMPVDIVSSFCAFWNLGIGRSNIMACDKEISTFGRLKLQPNIPYYDYAHNMYDVVCCIRRNDNVGAITNLRKQLQGKVSNGLEGRLRCAIYWYLAKEYNIVGKTDSMYYYSDKLLAYGRANNMLDVEVDACKLMLEYYEKTNNKDKEKDYQLMYFQKRDSLLVMHNLNNVKSSYLLGNIKNLNSKVENLKKSNHLKVIAVASVIVFLLIFVVVMILYRRKSAQKKSLAASSQNGDNDSSMKPKYSSSNLDEEEKTRLKQCIEDNLNNTDEIYNYDFSLERLSQLCGSHQKEISQVINEKLGCSFVILISTYRVREACRRINDEEHFGNLTLEAIGQSVGFKARESFSRAFKRVTGMSPSDYVKSVKK